MYKKRHFYTYPNLGKHKYMFVCFYISLVPEGKNPQNISCMKSRAAITNP